MTEVLLAAGVVLVLAGGSAALRAVLDGRIAGAPASITVLAPLAEVARLLRRRGPIRLVRQRFAGVVLLAAAGVQIAVLVGAPVWWLGATVVLRWGGVWALQRPTRRAAVAVVLTELVLAAAVAAPVIASGATTAAGIAAAQQPIWFAIMMPVAFLAFVVASGATRGPLSVALERDGGGSVLLLAGRALVLASAVALAVPLFLGGGSWPLLLAKAVVLMVAVVLAGRRFPRLGARTLPVGIPLVALALALLQLGLVLALPHLT